MNAKVETQKRHHSLLDARALVTVSSTPVARAVAGRLLAAIGQRCLAGQTPFDTSSGSYRLTCWLSEEDHLYLSIVPSDHRVDIEVERRGILYSARVTVPGEIVGMQADDGYTSVYFSLERGERRANLFGLLSAIGKAIEVTAFHGKDSDVNETARYIGIQSGVGIG